MNPVEALASLGGACRNLARRLATAEGEEGVRLWCEAADLFADLAEPEGVLASLLAARDLLRTGRASEARHLRADVEWRLGRTFEATGRPADATVHFEAAADAFRLDGDTEDEGIARLVLAENRLRAFGAGEALKAAREAIAAARGASDRETLVRALLLTGELYAELGEHESAAIQYREGARLSQRALEDGQGDFAQLEIHGWVGLAEALFTSGQVQGALEAAEVLGVKMEFAEGAELRARVAGLITLLGLEARVDEETLTRSLSRARQAFDAAGVPLRYARFLLQVGQRVERDGGPKAAIDYYTEAWAHGSTDPERFRLAPVAYALARCRYALEDFIGADFAIEEALRRSEEVADLEGLTLSTELGVLIAVALDQPNIAMRRLVSLARARESLGDGHGKVRSLIAAFEIALRGADLDADPVAEELMDSLRATGGVELAPHEFEELGALMVKAGRPDLSREIYESRAFRALADDLRHEAALYFITAAREAHRSGDTEAGEALFNRGIQLGVELGMRQIGEIRLEGIDPD